MTTLTATLRRAQPMLRMQVLVEQRVFWRNRSTMFFTFILPIVMLFVIAAGKNPMEAVPYIIALGILSTGFQGLCIQLVMHRDQGVLKRVMATPLPAWVLILGKTISTFIVIMIELVIMIAFAMLVFSSPFPHHPLLLILVTLLGTATFVALAFALASMISTSDSAPAMVNAAYLGLILISVLFETVDALPDMLQSAGQVLPLVHVFDPVSHAWLGGWERGDWVSLLVLIAWGVAGAVWTARRFRWEPVEER